MRYFASIAGGFALLGVLAAPSASAQSGGGVVHKVSGSYTYRTYCASCHGAKGKGDGPLASSLRFAPPDLTTIAERNNGEYPADEVYQMIDGRKPLPGHGGPDMPVWGDAFKNTESGFDDAAVKEKIQALVDYIKTLQVK